MNDNVSLIVYNNMEDIEIIKSSLLDNVSIINETDEIMSVSVRLGLMFHNKYNCIIPFFHDKFPNMKFKFYSMALVELLTKMVIKNGTFTLDLISCSMNKKEFVEETEKICKITGANINYSLNNTGNNGDWVLESNSENLKGIYFNNNINSWKHTLISLTVFYRNSNDIITYFNNQSGSQNTLTYHNKKYTLEKNVTIDAENIYIVLNEGEVFDGNNFTITYNTQSSGLFYINSLNGSYKTTIKNLKIEGTDNGKITYAGGGIINNNQSNFSMVNCHNISMTMKNFEVGGLVGSSCNNFKIENCTNSISLYFESGGIVGSQCSMFEIKNSKNLHSDDKQISDFSGGITGPLCNKFNIYNCINDMLIQKHSGGIVGCCCSEFKIYNCKNTANINNYIENEQHSGGITSFGCYNFKIKNCINSGLIDSNYGAGIVSSYCSEFEIKDCKNYGNISGNLAGGIVSNSSINFKIYNCTNNGLILGDNSGGIIGTRCYNIKINNCKNIGNIAGGDSGGIVGSNCSNLKINKCINTGIISGENSGGIGGNRIGSNINEIQNFGLMVNFLYGTIPIFTNYYTYILNSTNYGKIYGNNSGGIVGNNFAYLGDTFRTISHNGEHKIYNCKNKGKIINTNGGGIAGSNFGSSYQDGLSNILTIDKCKTRYGNLIGSNVLYNSSYYDEFPVPVPNKLIIKDSYTRNDMALVLSFADHNNIFPEDTRSAYYIKENGKKINLLKHPEYSS